MPDPLVVRDLTEFTGLLAGDEAWLERVREYVRPCDHVVRLGEAERDEDDVIVRRDERGQWQAGRYIGELAFEGRRLVITPRLGEPVVEQWLGEVFNLIAPPHTAARRDRSPFIARVMGAVWCRVLAEASRHGPPTLRRHHGVEGLHLRGRLDIRRTVRLRVGGSPHVASVSSFRDLDNPVSRVVVAAERALRGQIGHDQWHTPRVRELLPQMRAAVGSRPALRDARALARIRYTPITLPFKALADLSWRIARLEGLSADNDDGDSEGLLLDVAELWELFLLHTLRRALPHLTVEHPTTGTGRTWLMTSNDGRIGLGRLKPDLLVRDYAGEVVAVLDAKYKRLRDAWPARPRGVERSDIYQMTSYLTRYAADGARLGGLLYPLDPAQQQPASAEARGPWSLAGGQRVVFARVPLAPDAAAAALVQLLAHEDPGATLPAGLAAPA